MIKKTWLTNSGRDLYMLSIREYCTDHEFQLTFHSYDLPPTELIDGKRLNIEEARDLELVEPHHQLGLLTEEDLVKLRDAINKVLGYE